MSALVGDIYLWDEHVFLQVGVEIGFHLGIVLPADPLYEVIHSHLRAVGIEDFQPVAQFHHFLAHGLQTVRSLPGNQCDRFLIATDTLTHEVVGAEVADFQDGIGHHIGEVHEGAVILGRV